VLLSSRYLAVLITVKSSSGTQKNARTTLAFPLKDSARIRLMRKLSFSMLQVVG
jgi:hypothetical protein